MIQKCRFWDYHSGNRFQDEQTIVQPGSLESEAGINCMTFDMSGSRLITGEVDKTIKRESLPSVNALYAFERTVKEGRLACRSLCQDLLFAVAVYSKL